MVKKIITILGITGKQVSLGTDPFTLKNNQEAPACTGRQSHDSLMTSRAHLLPMFSSGRADGIFAA